MRRLCLGLAATIDDLEAGDRARVLVGIADMPAKAGVANLAIDQNLLDAALLLVRRRFQQAERLPVHMPVIQFEADGVLGSQRLSEAAPHDQCEILFGQLAYGLALEVGADPVPAPQSPEEALRRTDPQPQTTRGDRTREDNPPRRHMNAQVARYRPPGA